MNAMVKDARSVGMDPDGLARAAALLDEGAQNGLYPGGVVWVERRGATTLIHSTGYVDFEQTAPVDENTVYDLASVTKPVAMASSMLILCQQGQVHLGETVTDFFPERKLPHLKNVTLRHLITHTSGLPPWKDMYSKGQTREALIEELLSIPLDHDPGTHYAYSCLGYILLSVVLEKITGMGLDRFASSYVFEPLKMHSTGFNPNDWSRFPIAATDNCPMRKRKLVGEVHDGNSYAMGGVSGNAGLFSNAADLAKFCRAIAFPHASSAQVSSPFALPSLKKMFENAIPESIGGQTIGWFTFPNDMMPGGDLISRRAIGHSGFTGTAIIIDPEFELFAIMLTNRVCRDDDGADFRHLRRRIFNAIVGSIMW